MNEPYLEIFDVGTLIALIIRPNFSAKSTTFFTPPTFSQQLGYLKHTKGNIIKPHKHKISPRQVQYTQEVLFIKKGKLKVDLYNDEKKYITSQILNEGDLIFLAFGGHGFEIIEDSEIIEVKQGPYIDPKSDKDRFEGVKNNDSSQ